MKKLSIFIVDDDRDFAESLADVLELKGHKIELAFTGENAINTIRNKSFDITFMDVKLPGMNGLESFSEIKKINPDAKVIMMTGYSVEDLLEEALDNGAWKVLNKPLDMEEIIDLMKTVNPDVVLVADDDQDFCLSVREILRNKGYQVLIARDGQETIDKMQSQLVDILILDFRLPVLDGLDVYKELRKTGHLVPIILVTAYADEEAPKIKAIQTIDVLPKPFEPEKLISALERLTKSTQTN